MDGTAARSVTLAASGQTKPRVASRGHSAVGAPHPYFCWDWNAPRPFKTPTEYGVTRAGASDRGFRTPATPLLTALFVPKGSLPSLDNPCPITLPSALPIPRHLPMPPRQFSRTDGEDDLTCRTARAPPHHHLFFPRMFAKQGATLEESRGPPTTPACAAKSCV